MEDNFGRKINYMRISVTDRCNLRCQYCMPEDGVESLGHDKILSFENIEKVVKVAAGLGIDKIRLTGGEPLVRKGVVGLAERISNVQGIESLTLTTNAILLPQFAEDLKKAGVQRVNVSLDTLNHTKYAKITRGGELDMALDGINAAVKAGLTPLKINVVMMKGFNDDEIMDFVQLTYQHPFEIRFIELMPIGNAVTTDVGEGIITAEELKSKLPALKPLNKSDGVAEIFKYPGAIGTLGFITPMSSHFCQNCNKIRMTADGKLKPCLHSNHEIDLNEALRSNDDGLLRNVLEEAIRAKDDRHYLNEGAQPISRDMNKIGG